MHQDIAVSPSPNRLAEGRRLGHRRLGARLQNTAVIAIAATIAAAQIAPAYAQGGRPLPVIRDAEIESILQGYAKPIFRAAGVGSSNIEIILLNDKKFNAFVASGRLMFINIGVLLEAKTANEVIGVLAHETGHIAGGHLARLRQALERSQALAMLTTILAAGAIAAGAATGSSGLSKGGVGVLTGGASAAQRNFLSYQRGEEMAADRAALKYLDRTGQSAAGLLTTFRRLADQQLFSAKYADPYARSHPMPRERISQLEHSAKRSKHFAKKDPPKLQQRHDMMRAKIIGFTSHPSTVARHYPKKNTSLPARYARAIAAYRHGNPRGAVRQIDALIKSAPKYPYFWELKGQALVESGRPKDAVAPLRRAVQLAPKSSLIRISLGNAMVSANQKGLLKEAVSQLRRGLKSSPNSPVGWRQLAIAYARLGDTGMADLATAQGIAISGDIATAKRYAARAQKKLKRGSPGWLQADDIVSYTMPKL